MSLIFSKHSLEQMEVRQIPQSIVEVVLANPDQILNLPDKKIYQSVVTADSGNKYLIRIFVNTIKHPNLIITVYKTSKISKYYESKI